MKMKINIFWVLDYLFDFALGFPWYYDELFALFSDILSTRRLIKTIISRLIDNESKQKVAAQLSSLFKMCFGFWGALKWCV